MRRAPLRAPNTREEYGLRSARRTLAPGEIAKTLRFCGDIMGPMSEPKRPAVPEDASRREFLRATVAAGLVAAVRPRAAAAQEAVPPPPPLPAFSAPPIDRAPIGYAGAGDRAAFH